MSKKDTTESQCDALLKILKSGRKVTALEGVRRFGSTRLGARVYDLRRRGIPVVSRTIKTRSGKRVAEYSL